MPQPCHAIRRWTFSGLVGAFLDLSITFLLLYASTLAYFASKFLGLFGLNLPCSCNGFFGIPDNNTANTCLQSTLMDFPRQKISSVQSSIKNKFPFNSQCQWNSNLENAATHEGVGSSEGEASCISSLERRTRDKNDNNVASADLSKMKEKGFVMGAIHLPDVKEGRFEFKGKWVTRHKSRNGLRRRSKGSVGRNGKLSWNASYQSLWFDAETPQSATANLSTSEDDDTRQCGKDPVNFRGDDGREAAVDIGSKRKFSHGYELSESVDENEPAEENASPADELNSNGVQGLDRNARNTIRLLEQALEEEHAARAVLYVELEKERSAAATAADEAMAMILRLQEEKASIEMEARQCQRIIEEKYAYDAEEMNILKEILLRREREKYYLEKEVEAYRQIICGGEQLDGDMYGMASTKGEIMSYSRDDESVLILPLKSSDSIDKNTKAEKGELKELPSTSKLSEDDKSSNQGELLRHPSHSDEERKAQKTNITLKSIQSTATSSSTTTAHNLHQKETDKEIERAILDVPVIDDQSSIYKQVMEDKNKQPSTNVAAVAAVTSNSSIKTANVPPSIPLGLPPNPIISSKSRTLYPDMRRKSMSAFDTERFKIDSEITWLREKLKIVQEGREKLKFSKGNKEREKIQLQILEDITSQLREIRQLTEPGKAARRASLPPLTSNVTSTKRRWRSGPLPLEGSS